jgi:hypothetical protein
VTCGRRALASKQLPVDLIGFVVGRPTDEMRNLERFPLLPR